MKEPTHVGARAIGAVVLVLRRFLAEVDSPESRLSGSLRPLIQAQVADVSRHLEDADLERGAVDAGRDSRGRSIGPSFCETTRPRVISTRISHQQQMDDEGALRLVDKIHELVEAKLEEERVEKRIEAQANAAAEFMTAELRTLPSVACHT